jgi:hypothetical protein
MFARLGDYPIAAEMLEGAVQATELLPFTLYLMGHVELQLESRNIDKAKRCFQVALQRLDGIGGSQSFHHLGLAFTLKAATLHRTLGMLESFDDDLRLMSLGAIAANGIFEAPSRSCNTSPTSINSPSATRSIHPFISMDYEKSDLTPPDYSSDGSYSTKAGSISGKSTTPSIWRQRAAHLSPAALTDSFNSLGKDLIDGISHSSKAAVAVVRNQSLRHRSSKTTLQLRNDDLDQTDIPPVPPIPIRLPAYQKRLSQPAIKIDKDLPSTPPARIRMVARDPQCRGESTTALAHFIKSLPSQNAKIARDPEGHFGPMRELGEFLRTSGPEHARSPAVGAGLSMPACYQPYQVREVKKYASSLPSSYAEPRSPGSPIPESVRSSLLRGDDESDIQPLEALPTFFPPQTIRYYRRSGATLTNRAFSPPNAAHAASSSQSTTNGHDEEWPNEGWNGEQSPLFVLELDDDSDSEGGSRSPPFELEGDIPVALGSPVSPVFSLAVD